MKINLELYNPSFIDRILLFRHTIDCAYRIGKNAVIFICGESGLVYLKYSYAGNVQYHKIPSEDIDNYIKMLEEAKVLIDTRG